jgi:hypothetical protein
MHTRFAVLALVAGILVASGCQKLNFEKTYNVGQNLVSEQIIFSAPAYDQKVTVTIEPVSGPVSAYLMKSSDHKAVDDALNHQKEPSPSLLLGSRVSPKNGPAEAYSFDATVPAKTEYVLLLKAGLKSTEVKVKVVGK